MKAIILAAGLGSRLKNMTKDKPKALVEINGITMLEMVIQNLKSQGIVEFMINIHHLGQNIIDFLDANNNFDVQITISDERDKLLNTGGAILKATKFIDGNEPVLVHNVDILSDINYQQLFDYHSKNHNLVTLCVRKRDTNRMLLFDNYNNLKGWVNKKTGEQKWVDDSSNNYKQLAYSGIYIIRPEFPDHIKESGSFSIIDSWLEIAKNNTIKAFIDDSQVWHDLGTLERIKNAEH